MAKKKRKKRRKRRSSDPVVPPEPAERWYQRHGLFVGGVFGLGLGLMITVTGYEAQGPLVAVGTGVFVTLAAWFSFWFNFVRKRQD